MTHIFKVEASKIGIFNLEMGRVGGAPVNIDAISPFGDTTFLVAVNSSVHNINHLVAKSKEFYQWA